MRRDEGDFILREGDLWSGVSQSFIYLCTALGAARPTVLMLISRSSDFLFSVNAAVFGSLSIRHLTFQGACVSHVIKRVGGRTNAV